METKKKIITELRKKIELQNNIFYCKRKIAVYNSIIAKEQLK